LLASVAMILVTDVHQGHQSSIVHCQQGKYRACFRGVDLVGYWAFNSQRGMARSDG
jgi:hypothetical protein